MALAKRNPAGRHDRDHGRRRIDGAGDDRVREHKIREQTDIKYDITWNTLAEYLQYLEKRGVSCNVASSSVRRDSRIRIGFEDKQPTPEQLDEMRELVRKEMEAGALGIGNFVDYPRGSMQKLKS